MGIGDPVLASWMDRLHDWLKTSGFLTDAERAEVTGTIVVNGEPLRWGTISFVPTGGDDLPVAWSMVRRGQYSVPAHRGAVAGDNRVVIRTMGDVVPRPTIPDAAVVSGNVKVLVEVSAGENTFDFELKTK